MTAMRAHVKSTCANRHDKPFNNHASIAHANAYARATSTFRCSFVVERESKNAYCCRSLLAQLRQTGDGTGGGAVAAEDDAGEFACR